MKKPALIVIFGLLLLLSACAEAQRSIYDDFQLITHDEAGARRCLVWGGTSHMTCVYRLDELQHIKGEPVGVRVVGYLVRRGDGVYMAEMADGGGATVPVSVVRPSVIEWMPGRLIQQNRFAAALAIYDPQTATIELISIGALNVPGWPELEIPPPEER